MKVTDLKGKTIAFAASGGLDSCTTTRWLSDHGVRVVAITADLGQPDEKSMEDVRDRMMASGAADHAVVDAKDALVAAGLELIQAQATYEGRYWNTTGIARYVTTSAILKEMAQRGITILSHGATGRGNDQVRFQLAANMLAPQVQVYAPWRDDAFLSRFGGRSEMIDFCNQNKLPISATRDSPYSTDANMLGLTHEAGILESLETSSMAIIPGMGVHPKDAPANGEEFIVRFERGSPVAINDSKVTLTQAMLEANRIGGKHGIGIGVHLVENRFVGIKSRGVYEGPGMELLGVCYEFLQQLVLDRRSRDLFEVLSRYIAKQVYQGFWYDLGTQMARQAIGCAAKLISGTVKVNLNRGVISFTAVKDAPHSLYNESAASMERIGSYDHADSEGFLKILGVSARILAERGIVRDEQ